MATQSLDAIKGYTEHEEKLMLNAHDHIRKKQPDRQICLSANFCVLRE